MRLGRLPILTCCALAALAAVTLVAGCTRPNKANIELRRQNAELRDEIAQLQRSLDGMTAAVRSLESQATTVPVLPQDRLEALYTTHGLNFGRLTGGADLDPQTPGDEGIKVHIVPTDQSGEPLKAAGSFSIRLLDLGATEDELLLGEWTISAADARDAWRGRFMLYNYVFELPWQQVPHNRDLLVRAVFTDELTGRTFTAQREITVDVPPPSTQPSQSLQ